MTRDDWQAIFDERAGFLEYDEVMPRRKAEAIARKWMQDTFGYNVKLIRTER